MAALRDGDIISLQLDDDDAAPGYLATDVSGLFKTDAEHLLVTPSDEEDPHPASFQMRCLFKLKSGSASSQDELLYGQAFVLEHVSTGMRLTATSHTGVELCHPTDETDSSGRRLPHSAFQFFAEPRYKLRAEGDRVSTGDNVLLHSRRYAGSCACTHLTPLPPMPRLAARPAVCPRRRVWACTRAQHRPLPRPVAGRSAHEQPDPGGLAERHEHRRRC
jgi:hypothetical protein